MSNTPRTDAKCLACDLMDPSDEAAFMTDFCKQLELELIEISNQLDQFLPETDCVIHGRLGSRDGFCPRC